MRKIKLLSSNKVDIMVVDIEESPHIKSCIPNEIPYSNLPVRNIIPLILSYKFLWRLLIRSIRLREIRKVIYFSIVDIVQPKIIITLIDNSYILGEIHQEFSNILTISVQNGVRSGIKYADSTYSDLPVSMYYGFGEHEGIMMKSFGIHNDEYIPSGSLVYGLFKKKFVDINKSYDVCYIAEGIPSGSPQFDLMRDYQEKTLNSLIKVCKKLRLSLVVAMRYEPSSPSYELELNLLKKIDTNLEVQLIPNNLENFEGYNTCSKSKLIVAVSSTLAYEMFGAGSKVLFCASANNFCLAHSWDSYESLNKLPSMNLLDYFDVDSMSYKMNFLLAMKDNEYINKTKSSRKYYMNQNNTEPKHELIKTKITEFLSKT